MPRGLPSLGAVVCIAAIAGVAFADPPPDRRPVAVIDLTGGQDVGLSALISQELVRHKALIVAGTASVQAALQGPLLDEDAAHLKVAADSLATATQALDDFNFADAAAATRLGETELLQVTPTAATKPYADLAFAHGLAELGARQDGAPAFALAARLDPGRKPDPARYTPDVIRAYEKAAAGSPVKHPLAVTGTGHAWIDGVQVGEAPGTFQVVAGRHVVQLTGPERETRGAVVAVDGANAKVAIDDAPADEVLTIQRLRLRIAVAHASDAAAMATALRQLTTLLKVGDAVLVYTVRDKLWTQCWRDQDGGVFFAQRERTGETPLEDLAPLAPPPKIDDEPPPIPIPKKVVIEQPWYRNSWVQAGIAAGIISVAVTVIAIATQPQSFPYPGGGNPMYVEHK
jgi:hypothetical protein